MRVRGSRRHSLREGRAILLVGEEEAVGGAEDMLPIAYVFSKAGREPPHAQACAEEGAQHTGRDIRGSAHTQHPIEGVAQVIGRAHHREEGDEEDGGHVLRNTRLFLALFAGHQDGTQEAQSALAVPGQGARQEAQLVGQLRAGGGGGIGEGLAEGEGGLGLFAEAELNGPCEGGASGGAHRVLMRRHRQHGSPVGHDSWRLLFPEADDRASGEAGGLAEAEACAAAHPRGTGEEGLNRVGEVKRGVEDDAVPPEPGVLRHSGLAVQASLGQDGLDGSEQQLRIIRELAFFEAAAGPGGEVIGEASGAAQGVGRQSAQGEAEGVANGEAQKATSETVLRRR